MVWYVVRTITYILICVTLWFGGQSFIAHELQTSLEGISPYAIYVDQRTATAATHTGSLTFPFATINDGLAKAQESHVSTVIVSPGTYTEKIIVPENVLLFGEQDVTISYDPLSLQNVVQTGNNSALFNLHISGGMNAVMIPHNTSASLINVILSDADDFGVLMGKSDRPPIIDDSSIPIPYEYLDLIEEDVANLPLVYFRNVTVRNNKNQGMYLRDGRVVIEKSHIIENGEEGIDLHAHMLVSISDTESLRNGESGLETEIYDNIVTITNSIFDSNIKNGIGFNTSYGDGDMIITNSKIINNQQYGIRCARQKNSPDEPRPFFQSVITETNNVIENNIDSNISSPCFLF